MKMVANLLLAAWAAVIVPIWLLGMGFAGEIRFLPDREGNSAFWVMTAAMYLPPLFFAAVRLLSLKRRQDNA